jgi:hypothetical protein
VTLAGLSVLVLMSNWNPLLDLTPFGTIAILLGFLVAIVLGLAAAYEVADRVLWLQEVPADPDVSATKRRKAEERKDRWGPWTFPSAVRLAGWRRPPVVTGIVVWALLASIADPGTYHEARWRPATTHPVDGFTLDQYADRWSERWIELDEEASSEPEAITPLVMVAGSGGGIRAAYWTTAVLDCIVNRDRGGGDPCGRNADAEVRERRLRAIFTLSGISGSSLGLVTFTAGAIEDPAAEQDGVPMPVRNPDGTPLWSNRGWYRDLLDGDFLTPALGRWLFDDVSNVWLRQGADPGCRGGPDDCEGDRAGALELAWEEEWDDVSATNPLAADFIAWQTRGAEPHLPLLVLNSYSVEDGCRFNVSVLRSNGGRDAEQCRVFYDELAHAHGAADPVVLDATTDLVDFTACRSGIGDLPVSTAVLLSARFPFVSPSGKVQGCGGTTYAVDGGYRDTSAASTIVELWPHLLERLAHPEADFPVRGLLLPIFIQIDNGYDEASVPIEDSRPNELLVPVQGREAAGGGIANASKQAAERTFGCFVRITTRAHPGSQAPLGWVLSRSSEASLRAQLSVNGAAIDLARAMIDGRTVEDLDLDGAARCRPVPPDAQS